MLPGLLQNAAWIHRILAETNPWRESPFFLLQLCSVSLVPSIGGQLEKEKCSMQNSVPVSTGWGVLLELGDNKLLTSTPFLCLLMSLAIKPTLIRVRAIPFSWQMFPCCILLHSYIFSFPLFLYLGYIYHKENIAGVCIFSAVIILDS